MNTFNSELDIKRKKIETIVKVLAMCVAGFLFAPFAILTIKGLISLIVVGVIGLGVVNVGIPWLAVSLANWKLKALKAAAAANPIETLENRYAQLKDALLKQRDNIKQRIAIASKIYDQIKSFEAQFHKPSPRREQYEKLNALVEISKNKYAVAQKNLVDFGNIIEEKRSDWEIALSMAEANKLANVGEDFTSKLMQDTALTTIQDGLNMAFAELDASVMDENVQKVLNGDSSAVVTVSPSPSAAPTQAPRQLTAPSSELDFDFNGHSSTVDAEPEPVPAKRRASR